MASCPHRAPANESWFAANLNSRSVRRTYGTRRIRLDRRLSWLRPGLRYGSGMRMKKGSLPHLIHEEGVRNATDGKGGPGDRGQQGHRV
jgi:hypothetical protein